MGSPTTDSVPGSPSFVLGSGPSLLDLTMDERNALSRAPFVFAMNKYVLYWDRLGVHPSHYFLADTHPPAGIVLRETARRARELHRPMRFCLNEAYRAIVNVPGTEKLRALPALARASWRHRALLRFVDSPGALFFSNPVRNDAPLRWAKSLEKPLYFYRGSLTILLNLATILNPGNPIVLLGVDLDAPGHFFGSQLPRALRDRYGDAGAREGIHPTHAEIDGVPGILHRWDFVRASCEACGCPIFGASRKSLLVREGRVGYLSVEDALKGGATT